METNETVENSTKLTFFFKDKTDKTLFRQKTKNGGQNFKNQK